MNAIARTNTFLKVTIGQAYEMAPIVRTVKDFDGTTFEMVEYQFTDDRGLVMEIEEKVLRKDFQIS